MNLVLTIIIHMLTQVPQYELSRSLVRYEVQNNCNSKGEILVVAHAVQSEKEG